MAAAEAAAVSPDLFLEPDALAQEQNVSGSTAAIKVNIDNIGLILRLSACGIPWRPLRMPRKSAAASPVYSCIQDGTELR